MSASFRVVIRRTLRASSRRCRSSLLWPWPRAKEEKKAAESREQVERAMVRVADARARRRPCRRRVPDQGQRQGRPDGRSTADTVEVTWRNDFFKAAQGKVHMPFTLELRGRQVRFANALSLYVRAVKKGDRRVPPRTRRTTSRRTRPSGCARPTPWRRPPASPSR